MKMASKRGPLVWDLVPLWGTDLRLFLADGSGPGLQAALEEALVKVEQLADSAEEPGWEFVRLVEVRTFAIDRPVGAQTGHQTVTVTVEAVALYRQL